MFLLSVRLAISELTQRLQALSIGKHFRIDFSFRDVFSRNAVFTPLQVAEAAAIWFTHRGIRASDAADSLYFGNEGFTRGKTPGSAGR
jgi:hypothetical protein